MKSAKAPFIQIHRLRSAAADIVNAKVSFKKGMEDALTDIMHHARLSGKLFNSAAISKIKTRLRYEIYSLNDSYNIPGKCKPHYKRTGDAKTVVNNNGRLITKKHADRLIERKKNYPTIYIDDSDSEIESKADKSAIMIENYHMLSPYISDPITEISKLLTDISPLYESEYMYTDCEHKLCWCGQYDLISNESKFYHDPSDELAHPLQITENTGQASIENSNNFPTLSVESNFQNVDNIITQMIFRLANGELPVISPPIATDYHSIEQQINIAFKKNLDLSLHYYKFPTTHQTAG